MKHPLKKEDLKYLKMGNMVLYAHIYLSHSRVSGQEFYQLDRYIEIHIALGLNYPHLTEIRRLVSYAFGYLVQALSVRQKNQQIVHLEGRT